MAVLRRLHERAVDNGLINEAAAAGAMMAFWVLSGDDGKAGAWASVWPAGGQADAGHGAG